MTNTARGKDRANVFKCLSQTVTHLVYIIPLLLSHRCTHVIRRHLRLIKQPLEDEQRRYEFENEKQTFSSINYFTIHRNLFSDRSFRRIFYIKFDAQLLPSEGLNMTNLEEKRPLNF